jgi:hypothetical protein
MIKTFLILFFIVCQAVGLPMTINFQMVVKDNTGRPVEFQNEQITFILIGSVSQFWTETKLFSSPTGIINTCLGSVTPLDPVSFYAQDSIRLIVRRVDGDTLLSEPFNAVPYAYRAFFSDTSAKARDAALLGGKRPDEYLTVGYIATLKQMVSDSVWARPQMDPTIEISDTADAVRTSVKAWIGDTASLIRNTFGQSISSRAIRADTINSGIVRLNNDSMVFVGSNAWDDTTDSVLVGFGNSKTYIKSSFGSSNGLKIVSDNQIAINSAKIDIISPSQINIQAPYLHLNRLQVGDCKIKPVIDSITMSPTWDTLKIHIAGSVYKIPR